LNARVRRLLLLVAVVVFVDAMLFGALTPLIPGYAEEFGLSKSGAGLLAGAFGAGALLGGVPGGLAAAAWGPRRAVLLGLGLLAVASFGFALAGSAWGLGAARFVQGFSSTTTWAGALAWLTTAAPRGRRGELLGTAFGAAVFGAILGPLFGGVAELVSIRLAFGAVGCVALVLLSWTAASPAAPREEHPAGGLARAFADRAFLAGLWLNTLPALLFGTLTLLGPLALAADGFGPLAIGLVFLAAGLLETIVNPLAGRFSDRYGRLLPTRIALAASVVVATCLAVADAAWAITLLVPAASLAFGGFYTPGMALVSDRAETAALSQGLAFGVMNSAWAIGNMGGPALGGRLADAFGDGLPYLLGALLCALTLAATRSAHTLRM
jgi:MFS family permease